MKSQQPRAVIHYANAEDEATGEAYSIIRFCKVGNRIGEMSVPRADLLDQGEIYKRLIDHNAALLLTAKRPPTCLVDALNAPPRTRILHASCTGWRPDLRAFVTRSGTIDSVADRVRKIMPPLVGKNDAWVPTTPTGDLAGWKKQVAARCAYSSTGMVLLSAGFAAPVLKIVDHPSFGINIHAASKAGKSALLVSAASIATVGKESDLPNWAATPAARGEICRVYNDLLLPLNEVGLAEKSKSRIYDQFRHAIYSICEGRDRQRHSASLFATGAHASTQRNIFVSTAEHSVDYYARLAKADRDEGELARCIDLAATRPGFETVIDRFPPGLSHEEKTNWAHRQLSALHDACAAHHGVALEPYLRYLMRDPKAVRRQARRYMDEFIQGVPTERLMGALKHAAKNFSLIYAGGRLAIDAGVIDFNEERLLKIIRWHFLASTLKHGRGGSSAPKGDALAKGRKILSKSLRGGSLRQRGRNSTFSETDCEGFWFIENGRKKIVVHAAAFRKWFEQEPESRVEILRWLRARGFLVPPQTRSHGAGGSSGLEERTLLWPCGRLVRSVVFYDPFLPG